MNEISISFVYNSKEHLRTCLQNSYFFIEKKCFEKIKFAAIKSISYYLAFVFFRNVSVFLRLLKYVYVIHLLSCYILLKLFVISLDHIIIHWLITSQSKYLKPFRDSLYERFLKPFYLFTTYTWKLHIFVHPKYLQKRFQVFTI